MPWLVVVLVPLAAVALEVRRARTRRRLVEEWAHSKGWTMQELRYRFEPFGWNWLTYYWIEATDPLGNDHRGLVYATGFIRRKVDWSNLGDGA